jgi:hypothetical protein
VRLVYVANTLLDSLQHEGARITESSFVCVQETRVCPECGYRNDVKDSLRSHIEETHKVFLSCQGKEKVNNQVFWRSKRGVRRISQSCITRELRALGISKGEDRKLVIKALRKLLALALVDIGEDSVKPVA